MLAAFIGGWSTSPSALSDEKVEVCMIVLLVKSTSQIP